MKKYIKRERIHQKTIGYIIRIAHDGSICLYFLFFLFHCTVSVSDQEERYGLQVSNDRRKFMQIARPLPSFWNDDVRKRNEDRLCGCIIQFEILLRVVTSALAIVETPRCSRAEINSSRLRRSDLDSQLTVCVSHGVEKLGFSKTF